MKDAGLAEALAHIDALVPFIELPDLMLDGAITGAELIATNAAYRGGVLGSPIPIMADAAWPDRLAGMDVIVTDERSAPVRAGTTVSVRYAGLPGESRRPSPLRLMQPHG